MTEAVAKQLSNVDLPQLSTGVGQLAPFGVEMYELDVPLDVVVARVGEFHEVLDGQVGRLPDRTQVAAPQS